MKRSSELLLPEVALCRILWSNGNGYKAVRQEINMNRIITDNFSNDESRRLYESHWPDEPELFNQYEEGGQCGGCAFFALFNADYGLCCHAESRHHLETVFEHFGCNVYEAEGWGAHSFRKLQQR